MLVALISFVLGVALTVWVQRRANLTVDERAVARKVLEAIPALESSICEGRERRVVLNDWSRLVRGELAFLRDSVKLGVRTNRARRALRERSVLCGELIFRSSVVRDQATDFALLCACEDLREALRAFLGLGPLKPAQMPPREEVTALMQGDGGRITFWRLNERLQEAPATVAPASRRPSLRRAA